MDFIANFLTWFVRHSYWMFNLGVIVGVGIAVGAWFAVHKMQEWREQQKFSMYINLKKPVQSASVQREKISRVGA